MRWQTNFWSALKYKVVEKWRPNQILLKLYFIMKLSLIKPAKPIYGINT